MQTLTPQQRTRKQRVNGLAVMVAEGYTIRAAGEALGVSLSTAKSMWAEIKRDLGGAGTMSDQAREELQQIADGAMGDGPLTRGKARDLLASMPDAPDAAPVTRKVELLPCPFCGGAGATGINCFRDRWYGCETSGCAGEAVADTPTAWNTRLAAEAQHRERAEALEVSLKATAKALASTTSRLIASEQRVRALVEAAQAVVSDYPVAAGTVILLGDQEPAGYGSIKRLAALLVHPALLPAAEGESGEVGK
jgi:hypothetical protein